MSLISCTWLTAPCTQTPQISAPNTPDPCLPLPSFLEHPPSLLHTTSDLLLTLHVDSVACCGSVCGLCPDRMRACRAALLFISRPTSLCVRMDSSNGEFQPLAGVHLTLHRLCSPEFGTKTLQFPDTPERIVRSSRTAHCDLV